MLKKFYWLFLPLFTLSGFAALIYESLWTQYLKLLLGHSAYAQLLVLVTFMGGLGIGSWLAAKFTTKIPNLLKTYAIVEGLIALIAFSFHFIFIETESFLYDYFLRLFQDLFTIRLFLWLAGALILLPQTILLGATFPLMAGAMIRRIPKSPGRITALLYFVNSIGGSIGILVAGFFLLEAFGLPGTAISAGLLNVVIALILWFISNEKNVSEKTLEEQRKLKNQHKNVIYYIHYPSIFGFEFMLIVAFMTGFSSFFYEIGWIRMLSMVLGSATHSFEIMVSAFIFGLAIGGLVIYYWLPRIKSPLLALGYIQIVMGLAAILSIPMYNELFYWMENILLYIPRTESNYLWFNTLNHGLCLVLMLPTTVCAGMTFPLITHILLEKHYGEKSIGHVYSLNTFGSILGAIIALYWVMPGFGLKTVIGSGAIIDILLGYLILFSTRLGFYNQYRNPAQNKIFSHESHVPQLPPSEHHFYNNFILNYKDSTFIGITVVIIFYMINILGTSELDIKKMASGVFRLNALSNQTVTSNEFDVLFHRDGRTATVAVTKINDALQVTTNGKTDASLSLTATPTSDETPQTLFAALPYAVYPNAKTVAVIGFGSGMTTATLLDIPSLQQVDTIEIEPFMVEGGRYFGKKINNVFQDRRSKIIFDDARSFFEVSDKKYDVIISIPSNPWVSGVSSLFTTQFYSIIQKHLNEDGIFVQWLGLYELSADLAGSVFNAINDTFPYYNLYFALKNNVLIVASNQPLPKIFPGNPFLIPNLNQALQRIGMHNLAELNALYYGNETTLLPFLRNHTLINSDFYPVLDMGANRSRFLLQSVNLKDFQSP